MMVKIRSFDAAEFLE